MPGGKTEEPTPRRRERARQQGDVAISRPLTQAVVLLPTIALAPAAVAAAGHLLQARLLAVLRDPPAHAVTATSAIWDLLRLVGPWLAAAGAAAAAMGILQAGGAVRARGLGVDTRRLNPLDGLADLFDGERLFGAVRALVAVGLLGFLLVRQLLSQVASLGNGVGNLEAAYPLAWGILERFAWTAALVGLALGFADLLFTRRSWWQRLRMTRDEIRRELRETTGDPALKTARQRAHQEALDGSLAAAVRDASVVVAGPAPAAVALAYDPSDGRPPRIVARGPGKVASVLIDCARLQSVPVVVDAGVAGVLRHLDVGQEIPAALYETVAELLQGIEAERGSPRPQQP